MSDVVEVSISVELQANGTYEVVTRKDGVEWVRDGPYDTLEEANTVCSMLLKRAEELRNSLVGKLQ